MGMHTLAYAGFAAAQAALAVWAFVLWRRDRAISSFALMLPIATVWYDNLIIAIGSYIGAGQLLETLTTPRFVGHALVTPIWIVAGVALAIRAGVFPGRERLLALGSWILYGSMVIVGLINEVISFKGMLVTEGDVLYYTNVGRLFTPPPPSLTMLIVVLICGALVLWKTKWPWMLLGGLPVLLSRVMSGDGVAFLLVNSGEVIMSASLVATLAFIQRREAQTKLPTRALDSPHP